MQARASISTIRLILAPASFALAVTLARLVGELRHWPTPRVNPAVCGKAILGVAWLVPIFGVYFALQLFAAQKRPRSLRGAIGWAFAGLILKLAGTAVMESGMRYSTRLAINILLTGLGLVLAGIGWRVLCQVLLIYGYASRIAVAVVQFFAMRGGWSTHYDALDPGFPAIGFWPTYLRVSLVPNVLFMEVYTAILGTLFGSAALALLHWHRQGCRGTANGKAV